jgi:Protein of unknown function (DUF3108)
MSVLSRFLLPSRRWALPVALALIASPAGAADKIAIRGEVFGMGGMHVATDRATIEQNGNNYAISGDLKTGGLAGLFQDFQSHATARGRLPATGAQPEAYSGDVRRDSGERHDKVDFRAGAVATGSSTGPAKGSAKGPAKSNVSEVSATPATSAAPPPRDTVDPLTAYFLVERRLGTGGDCAISIPVFDGRHRYNLQFTDAGEQNLSASDGQHYSGPAKACKMSRENVAGYPTDKLEMPKRGTIWYARLMPGDLMLPVKLEMVTDIGSVTGHLAELHGRGADLKFPN